MHAHVLGVGICILKISRNKMKKKPIKLLFNAMYHEKYSFNNFIQGDMSADYSEIKIKERVVYKPSNKLKAYLTFLNLFLLEYLDVNKRVVFSYRKGVSAYDAVSKHAQSKHFFQTDVSCFFASIDSALIKKTLLGSYDSSPITDIDKHLDRIINLVVVDNVLPMGFSTSPSISNACLFTFDNMLEEYCLGNNLLYSRYSDDIIISSKNRDDISGMDLKVNEYLQICFLGKLNLNISKSKFTHVGRKIKLLGMVILPTGKVTVDMKFKSNIEVLLHFYISDKDKFLNKVDGDMAGGVERITGYLNYVNSVDRSYLDKIRKKFGATVVDEFLHQLAK